MNYFLNLKFGILDLEDFSFAAKSLEEGDGLALEILAESFLFSVFYFLDFYFWNSGIGKKISFGIV
jgi:hypothetical protein